MELGVLPQLQRDQSTIVLETQGTPNAVTGFPLRDYLGTRDPERPPVGMVLTWLDVSRDQAMFKHSTLINIFFAFFGFLIIEIILFWGIRASSKKLERVIDEGKADLQKTNDALKEHIIERKQAEKDKMKMQARLLQAQKLESVGQLAAGIAHEVNTPAQYVKSNIVFLDESFQEATTLLRSYDMVLTATKGDGASPEMVTELEKLKQEIDWEFLSEEIPEAIEQSKEGIDKISNIVRAMKEFSHSGGKEKTPTDINHLLTNTITVSRHEWQDIATVKADLSPSLPQVPCLGDELGQVILNILFNAKDAIGARLASQQDCSEGLINISSRQIEDSIEIRIQDNGSGIPAKIQTKIFDPFFTTKEVGQGTGQGMCIARDVVEKMHGGYLSFETTKGEGTTFIISLPMA